MFVDKVALVTLACRVLHNYCEINRQRVPMHVDVRFQHDPYVGFHVGRMQLPREGLDAKLACRTPCKCLLFDTFLSMEETARKPLTLHSQGSRCTNPTWATPM